MRRSSKVIIGLNHSHALVLEINSIQGFQKRYSLASTLPLSPAPLASRSMDIKIMQCAVDYIKVNIRDFLEVVTEIRDNLVVQPTRQPAVAVD